MSQLIEINGTKAQRPAPRYEPLLHERVLLGRIYVDAVCHGAPFDEATLLYSRIARLDKRLDRYRRYSCDYERVVMAAEDDRWHVPGQPPVAAPECRRCIKAELGVPLSMVLPLQPLPPLPERRAA